MNFLDCNCLNSTDLIWNDMLNLFFGVLRRCWVLLRKVFFFRRQLVGYFQIRNKVTLRSSRPEVFFRKGVLKICSKFTGEHSCRSLISINLQSNFIEITIWHGCSPVILLHIFRTPFLEHLWTATSEPSLLVYRYSIHSQHR